MASYDFVPFLKTMAPRTPIAQPSDSSLFSPLTTMLMVCFPSSKFKNSRLVARALSHAEQFGEFPCHRVVNHAGRLAPGWVEQGFLLMQEGVELKNRNHVDLKKYQWDC